MKKMAVLLAGVMLIIATGNAMATSIAYTSNDRTPAVAIQSQAGQKSLQTVLNELTGTLSTDKKSIIASTTNTIDASKNQSTVGAWSTTDLNSTAFRVALVSPMGGGTLGIKSLANGTEKDILTATLGISGVARTFSFDAAGNLYLDNNYSTVVASNFGNAYAFYWKDTSGSTTHKSYTMDSLNSGYARALSYQVQDNTYVNIDTNLNSTNDVILRDKAEGGNDWVIAFDNYFINTGTELYNNDFNDAVFFVKDMNPVPEPGTMALLGFGLLGLAVYGKRRMNKEA